MKTHKAASSTIENIMFRYTYENDLNLAMPLHGNYLSKVGLFHHKIVRATPWGRLDFHTFTLHNRWNYKEVIRLMGNETKTFSVVRDPVDLFESMYGYMRMENTYHVGLRQFVQLVGNESAALLTNRRQSGQFGRNSMAWDWGIQPNLFDNDVILEQRLRSLDAQFQLVLVAERLEESLVLLRHLLCWPVETVTHLVINQRKRDKIVALTAAERQRLRKWLRVDYLLYDHYVQLLDDKIRQFNLEHGDGGQGAASDGVATPTPMEREVQLLRDANERLRQRCVLDHVGNERLSGKFKETNDDIMGYVVRLDDPGCHLYAMSEPAYLEIFRQNLLRHAKEYHPK